jgi:hypothetical protein
MNGRPAALGAFLDQNVSPGILFLAGALLFPAFLFQRDLGVRCIQVVLFFLLSALCGRRVRILQNLIMAAGIIIFGLIIPAGRVLVSVLGLPVTDGALRVGVIRATAVIGMIGLSQFSIRASLRLPGTLGGLIGRTLFYFERIMGERKKLRRESLLHDVDAMLLSFHAGPEERPAAAQIPGRPRRTTAAGAAVLSALLAVNWGALAFTYLRPGLIWPA